MHWKIKAGIQKALSATKIGDRANHSLIVWKKDYHRNVVVYQASECLRKVAHANPNSRSSALEIGTGYSLISAIVLSLLGFEQVITADISKDADFKTCQKQLAILSEENMIRQLYPFSKYSAREIGEKLGTLKGFSSLDSILKFLNITYLAPYQFDDIEKFSGAFDYIASQVVLEHVSPDLLDLLFKKTKLWLTPEGTAVHTINFIDHFANDGLFQDKTISEFNFLRFSDSYWSYWAENSIAYTNRLCYLYYLELAYKYDLKVVDFLGENYRKRVELDLSLIHPDVIGKYAEPPCLDDLVKYQRGTLILKAGKS